MHCAMWPVKSACLLLFRYRKQRDYLLDFGGVRHLYYVVHTYRLDCMLCSLLVRNREDVCSQYLFFAVMSKYI